VSVALLFLTVISLIALVVVSVEPATYAPVARILLILFTAHSIAAVLVLRTRPRSTKAFALTTHTVDLLSAALTLPMAAPTNPFFAFFLFVLASAAFRWGFRETVATTAAAVGLMLIYTSIISNVPALSVS
jgi:hypothetical protein